VSVIDCCLNRLYRKGVISPGDNGYALVNLADSEKTTSSMGNAKPGIGSRRSLCDTI